MIHKYKFRDKFIVLDINSGAAYEVSELFYSILDICENRRSSDLKLDDVPKDIVAQYGKNAVIEALDEMKELVSEGVLFSEESFTKEQFANHGKRIVKAMCLHVAHDCNMNCRYCFGEQGSFEGQRSFMSFETGKKAIDYLLENSGDRHNLEIDFFGGEPLMNFEVVKQLVIYGASKEKECHKHIRFTITTNGLLLCGDKADFINKHMDNVILSIDGRPEVNDAMRRTRNGENTHATILQNHLNFVKQRQGSYYVRGTFTRENLDFSDDVKYLTEQGFMNVSVEPVVSGQECGFAIREEDLPRIMDEYDKITDFYIEKIHVGEGFDFFHFNIDMEQGPCVIKRLSGCGAGSEYLAISPEGDIYPCHQFVGNHKFLMGNLNDMGGLELVGTGIEQANIFNKPECMECWAKYYCSGGCHANAYHSTGDILSPYKIGCEMEKKRIECAIGANILKILA